MELSMAEIALIQIACRVMLENELQEKDKNAYKSLLGRLTIVVKGKKLKIELEKKKDELAVIIPPRCLKVGGGSHE